MDYTGATNPLVTVIWPPDGSAVSGTNCTLRGTMSDETGTILAQVINNDGTNVVTNTVSGLIERNNMFWLENVPLNGTDQISIQATDASGLHTTVTNITLLPATLDALGNLVVSNVYDGFGHIVNQYTQGSTNKTWNIFWSDWETVSQDPAGSLQCYFYDDLHRQIGHQDALGNLTQTVYDGQDHMVANISALNETNLSFYDGNNNLVGTVDPTGATNQFIYDTNNDMVQSVDARGNSTFYHYNSKFVVNIITNAMGDGKRLTFNADGTLATTFDSAGTTTYSYDNNGYLSSVVYPNGLGTNGYLNNALGDVLSQTNARGFVTSFKYNARRELTNSIGPTNLITRVVYDAADNVISTTDPRGFSTTNTWSICWQTFCRPQLRALASFPMLMTIATGLAKW
ncbi:MAG TPA: hypothetical protein VG347_23610 [Verrucomicrobiae bacterium]|nr:hypothetical protein [Verrucomicrobiae bacterium]